eukprot:TRINITY_DN1833_c0_g3_i2.p1 TRINITY_DN1833_c0_g3~~TRINITY_DN1833_c0_g3_i2.p1  ORF type:complete len:478 (+),score=124.98 TRINITY_DN1833_c0_g3_i2:312-1745(+)
MKQLKKNSIPKIYKHGALKQVRMNVTFFLEAAREYGVPSSSLFTWTEFRSRKNRWKILETLESIASISLSLSEVNRKQMKRLIRKVTNISFDPIKVKSAADEEEQRKREKEKKDEEERKRIKNLQARLTAEDKERYATKIQSFWRGHKQRKSYKLQVRQEAFRSKVAKEIFSSEVIYVSNLRLMCKVFLEPLRKAESDGKPIISKDQIRHLFGDTESILNVNSHLLTLLEPKLKSWTHKSTLGDFFLTIADFMKCYTQYVRDYDTAVSLQMELMQKNSKFAAFIKEGQENPSLSGLSFGAFMILPVQRIPRYQLLLRELCTHTSPEHPDYVNLNKAYEKMKDVVHYVNESKKESDNIAKVLEIQSNFVGKFENLALRHRRFVREGPVVVDNKKSRYAYLFNDLFILTSPVSSSEILFRKSSLKAFKELKPSGGNALKRMEKNKKKIVKLLSLKKISINYVDQGNLVVKLSINQLART